MAALPSSSTEARAERGLLHTLIKAAAAADDDALSALLPLTTDRDLNAVDEVGRTVLGAAIAGNSWKDADASDASFRLEKRLSILKMLLGHGGLSLYSLNAPQDAMEGVTPLGLAAWLNIPDAVALLLRECPGSVTVNGMDSRGATPLMYAARDGNIEVVLHLLEHGARPDYRDIHHRTSVYHALRHPQVLHLCEVYLRRRRALETITKQSTSQMSSPSSLTDEPPAAGQIATVPRCHHSPPSTQELRTRTATLISAVLSQDIHELDYLLFSSDPALSMSSSSTPVSFPFLANYPDEQGWSPIHHCVSVPNPSSTVLDILYRAGADMSLYTLAGHNTPLHCLARKASASTSSSIRSFIHHLVHDLRAPLAALDHEGETCIHVAAEHGNSIEVLSALLDCDTDSAVQNMRNSRGLIALDVVQPRLRAAFGIGAPHVRSESSASFRTIRPSTSLESPSFTPPPELRAARALGASHDDTLPMSILDNLDWISQELEAGENVDVQVVDDVLHETTSMGERYLTDMLNRIEDAVAELHAVRTQYDEVAAILEDTTLPTDGPAPLSPAERDSGVFMDAVTNTRSSESTMVSSIGYPTSVAFADKKVTMVDVAISAVPPPEDDDTHDPCSTTPSTPSHTQHSLRTVKSLTDIPPHQRFAGEDRGLLGMVSPWMKGLPRKRSKSDLTANRTSPRAVAQTSFEESLKNRTARLRAWFKKKLMPDAGVKITIVMALDEQGCAVGREVKTGAAAASAETQACVEATVKPQPAQCSVRTLVAARTELSRIQEHLKSTDRHVGLTSRYITEASQLLMTIVQEYQKSLDAVRIFQAHLLEDEARSVPPTSAQYLNRKDSTEFPPVKIPSSPRDSQLIFPRPPPPESSSLISFSSTLIEGDDENVLRFRKLLTRKVQTRMDSVYEGIEKATVWVRIVRDVTRTVRQSAEN